MNALRNHSYLLVSLLCFLVLATPLVTFAEAPGFFQGMVYTMVITVTGWFLGLGGLILNYGINDFLLGFGKTFGDTGIGLAVNTTWTTIRDFVNMTFIFGLVYIGFKMILDSNDSNTKKWIANLVLAALLINFSLLITKGVIEVSNQFAIQIVESGFSTYTDSDGYEKVNMSATLMDMLGITNVWGGLASEGDMRGATGDNAWGYIFGTGILFMITAFVFAAGGILLIIRFAILNFYMVLSPVLFLGFILPPLQGSLQKYWSEFLKKCFFAPVYVLLLYFSFQILDGMQTSSRYSAPDFGAVTANSGAAITESAQSTIPFFILTCFFLIGSLVIANKMSADGAGKAISMGKGYAKWAGDKTKNGASRTGRFAASQTAGRAARAASDVTGTAVARRLNTLQQGNGLTARIARSNGVQGTVGGAAVAMQNTRFGLSGTRNQDRATRNATDSAADRRRNIQTEQDVAPITDTSTDVEITARQEARGRLQNEVRQMSNEQIQERARQNREEVMSPEFASLLSDAQVAALQASGILTNAQSDELEANRDTGTFAEIEAVLNNSNASTDNLNAAMEALNRTMSTMSNERIANMVNTNPTLGTNPNIASRLSSAQIDALRQSGNLTSSQMASVTNARNDGFVTIARHGSLANPTSQGGSDTSFQDRQRRGMFRNAQDAGRLPIDVLAATASAQYLTPRIIEEYLNNNPSDPDMSQVRTNINNYLASGRAPANASATWTNWTNRTVAGRQFGL